MQKVTPKKEINKMKYEYKYPRPMLTVDIIVFKKNEKKHEVLLIQRKNPPFQDMWAFPGGFMDMDEPVENTAVRELKEETGLFNIQLKQLHTFSKLGRDPRGRTVTVAFYGFTNESNATIKGMDDAKKAKWFPIDKTPNLAFDHNEILTMALDRIKYDK